MPFSSFHIFDLMPTSHKLLMLHHYSFTTIIFYYMKHSKLIINKKQKTKLVQVQLLTLSDDAIERPCADIEK